MRGIVARLLSTPRLTVACATVALVLSAFGLIGFSGHLPFAVMGTLGAIIAIAEISVVVAASMPSRHKVQALQALAVGGALRRQETYSETRI